uniref:Uncharacterized protein n=1 Tax=Salarias fasciatus TaxID=181472 RepID=A0A672HCV8_SALFA
LSSPHEMAQVIFLTLMDNAEFMYQKCEYDRAINNFSLALDLKPGDKHCLLGRSRCYRMVGKLLKAVSDAKASLKEDKAFCSVKVLVGSVNPINIK